MNNLESMTAEQLEKLIDNWIASMSHMRNNTPEIAYVAQKVRDAEKILAGKRCASC